MSWWGRRLRDAISRDATRRAGLDHTAALEAAERNARAARRAGLAGRVPVPPWEWRKGEKAR